MAVPFTTSALDSGMRSPTSVASRGSEVFILSRGSPGRLARSQKYLAAPGERKTKGAGYGLPGLRVDCVALARSFRPNIRDSRRVSAGRRIAGGVHAARPSSSTAGPRAPLCARRAARGFAFAALFLLLAAVPAAARVSFAVVGDEEGSWPKILEAAGLVKSTPPDIFVIRAGEELGAAAVGQWRARIESGALVVLEGESALAAALGIRPGPRRIPVRSVVDHRNPKLRIVWRNGLDLPVFDVPAGATVFARERWTGTPMMVGLRRGAGAVLWLAVPPGPNGYDRFPYLPQALVDLGARPAFLSRRLWAFFDSSYRARVDLDYFAARWRQSGIAALHVAAWHYNEPDPQRDAWLRALIDACHRRAILVYAWIELPHVSERFWQDHPECREKTATLQDAHLDWRKLVNLQNRECAGAVKHQVRDLIARFDWDGVNLGELYFESLEGASNPARFTPMNDDVRRQYRALRGVDPLRLFQPPGAGIGDFLAWRADLARRMQGEWIDEIETIRRTRRDLDLVLTHVDDRFDPRMRELIGADAARVLPLLDSRDFTFLIEDPATVWHLGPDRYPQIAARYQPLTRRLDKLAIDINIVERYQDVYPTKQQTGTELFQLVHLASRAFRRVALYFENSILAPDLALLPASAAAVTRYERLGSKTVLDSLHGVGMASQGPVLVNGALWPVRDETTVWLPPGPHAISAADREPPLLVTDLNADLKSARVTKTGIEFAYSSSSRAIARLSRPPRRVVIDGEPVRQTDALLFLPRGQHVVEIYPQTQ